MYKNNKKIKQGLFLFLLLILFIICAGQFSQLTTYGYNSPPSENNINLVFEALKYERAINVLAMVLIGIALLMLFIRNHGYSSITAVFLGLSIGLPLYMLVKAAFNGHDIMAAGGVDLLLYAEFAATSLLIAMGAPIGRLRVEQYALMSLMFIPAYIFNEWLINASGYFPGFFDTGGSLGLHAFGAYFGLGVVANTYRLFVNKSAWESSYSSNILCLTGTMVLWAFWPSFNSTLVAPDRVVLTGINTLFALCGSTISTCIFTKMLRGKFECSDIANAALAGGVSISAVCNITTPSFSLLIGLAAGCLTTLGYVYVSPRVESILKGTDAGGIQNLHGMPGIFGGLISILLTGNVVVQLAGIVVTVVTAFVCGRITGGVIMLMSYKEYLYNDGDEFMPPNCEYNAEK